MLSTRRTLLLGGLSQLAWSAGEYNLRAGRAQAKLSPSGGLSELRFERTSLVATGLGDGCLEISINGRAIRCDRPVKMRRTHDGATFEYRVEHLDVTYDVALRALNDEAAVLVQRIAWKSDRRYSDPVGLSVPRNVRLPAGSRNLFIPTREGIAKRAPIQDSGQMPWLYLMAGGDPDVSKQRLAAPLVSEYSGSDSLRLTVTSEPGCTTAFQAAGASQSGKFGWIHTTGGEPGQTTTRTFYTVMHRGDDRRAFHMLYDSALADVRPGPAWLHEITMVSYDYLSKNGRGWFADIDALARLIPVSQRNRVVLTIHGWYDYVGRYAFNPKSKALDRKWTAFPNVTSPQFLAHARGPQWHTATHWGWRKILDGLRPVEMSIDDLRRRMRYARERGFRCVLYFGDGVNSGDGLAGIHEPEKVLVWGGWIGPETSGKTYAQNPLHPGVQSFYKDYLQALLAEFGRDLDGFVWDETFHVRAGQKGTEAVPGYADAAMMSLVNDLRAATERYSSNLAFLTSDIIGPGYQTPYSLVSHGTYQDSMSGLRYWPYGLFPNLRNSLWSCNWYHQTTWDRNEKTVATYELPVAVSNGYGDDTGPSDMTAEQAGRMMALFNALGNRRLELSWIEDSGGAKTYKGRSVPAA
jgi:hypothetical protein